MNKEVRPDIFLITGGTGRLGCALRSVFPTAAFPSHAEMDLCDRASLELCVQKLRPTAVIHAAAFTDVARGETEKGRCWDVNVHGTERLVDSLLQLTTVPYFLFISTACVFRGDTGNYDENSVPDPKNFYGLTKLVGEYVARRMPSHLIVRTNFVTAGPWPHHRAFRDRQGTYLFTHDVARAIREVIDHRMEGVVHIAGNKTLSMYELAQITTPGIEPMTMRETDLPLTVNMTLRSVRVRPFDMTL